MSILYLLPVLMYTSIQAASNDNPQEAEVIIMHTPQAMQTPYETLDDDAKVLQFIKANQALSLRNQLRDMNQHHRFFVHVDTYRELRRFIRNKQEEAPESADVISLQNTLRTHAKQRYCNHNMPMLYCFPCKVRRCDVSALCVCSWICFFPILIDNLCHYVRCPEQNVYTYDILFENMSLT